VVYHRKDRNAWFVAVSTPHGRVKRSTGTNHKPTAKAMERMLFALGPKGQRARDLLDRVAKGTLMLATLYDAYANNDLDGLRKRIEDANLADHVDAWQAWLVDRVSVDTCAHYLAQLRTLVAEGKPYPRSQFTAPEVARWLATRTGLAQKRKRAEKGSRRAEDKPGRPISGATKRKYLAAAHSFATYLVEVGVLASNPIRDVQAPPPGKPRVVEIPLSDVMRIVENAAAPYPALFALLYGAGVEISAALACIESDVDVERREVRARGTKAHARDRIVRVAEWAWPFLEKHHATLTPGERLFRGLDRWQVGGAHRARLTALGLPHHRVHDSRHFYAIRAIRAGTPYELVARQLGHADVAMVAKVYGRFAPRSDERDRWEKIAATLDEKSMEMGTAVGTSPSPNENDKARKPLDSRASGNSRGGTRTHDPGIMSAVL